MKLLVNQPSVQYCPLDKSTNLYYYRLRDYNPKIGRFLQPDPLGQISGPNIYAYCNNNPVNWVDPWGLRQDFSKYLDSVVKNPNKTLQAFPGITEQEHQEAAEALGDFYGHSYGGAIIPDKIPFKKEIVDILKDWLGEYFKDQTKPDDQKSTDDKSKTEADDKRCK